jgi:hypothetical protein
MGQVVPSGCITTSLAAALYERLPRRFPALARDDGTDTHKAVRKNDRSKH